MKRLYVSMVSFLVFCLSLAIALAEMPDLSVMTYDELLSLKMQVDAEYVSRPDSEGIVLNTGYYIVGEDIKPGHYYVAMVNPHEIDSSSIVYIYKEFSIFEKNKAEAIYNNTFYLGNDPCGVYLDEGNVFHVFCGSVLLKSSAFKSSDYYTYTPPKGTFIMSGEYAVGDDIPSGRYIIYPGSVNGGTVSVYKKSMNEDGEITTTYIFDKISLNVKQVLDSKSIRLEDGYTVNVIKPVILTKAEELIFEQ